jgi:glycosyltransferase involved in cell wall biosynthesis
VTNKSVPVTVVIPAHPARVQNGMLNRALASIEDQTVQPEHVIVKYDRKREGAARTRQKGLEEVQTEWVAFLDSDDEWLPQHLEKLYTHALDTGADLVYPWYHVVGGGDPLRAWENVPWDPARPHLTTITVLCKTRIAQSVGFVQESYRKTESGEDWYFIRNINAQGAKIVHLPERTWKWHHHGKNSSGLPNRGDAKNERSKR